MKKNTKKLAFMAMLAAISVVLIYILRFPLFTQYLEFEIGDVPVLIGTFIFGPVSGLILIAVAAVIQGFTVSAGSGVLGIVMHICATGTYVIVAGLIYKKNPSIKGAILAVILGTLAMALIMIPLNLILTVYFGGVPREAVLSLLLPAIIPFNLIKAGANGIITLFVYKQIAKALRFDTAENKKTEITSGK